MDIPISRGQVARQAHVDLPEGTCEEEYGRNGFFGRYAHLYRRNAPVGWSHIDGAMKPRAFALTALNTDAMAVRKPILGNADVRISVVSYTEAPNWIDRNADADELYFVHRGEGTLCTDFGPLDYKPGDYLLVPRGINHRFCPKSPTWMLSVESMGEIDYPDKGMLGQHALFDPSVIEFPTPDALGSRQSGGPVWDVRVRHGGQVTRIQYPFDPMDVIGWKGTIAASRLSVHDIRPVLSDRYHLPPSAHTTFIMRNAVVCSFLPRPLENGDPGALRVPFYHSNIDFDEVLFYHNGDFFSRVGIDVGMLTLHPQGIHHGPQPGASKRAESKRHTDEIAIMIDTKNTLYVLESAEACEKKNYWKSWMTSPAQPEPTPSFIPADSSGPATTKHMR